MNRFMVVWKQEMKDGSQQVLDTTFDTREEVDNHIKNLKEGAITLKKPFRLISITDLSNKKIKPNKDHVGRSKKGKGWHGKSREHGLARKGISSGKRK